MKKFLTSIVLVVSLVVFAIPALARDGRGTVYPGRIYCNGCYQYTSKCGKVITGTGAAPTPEAAWSIAQQKALTYLNQHESSCSACQQK